MQNFLLIGIGIASGVMIAGGMYAVITTLGIINRIAQDTHTAKDIVIYEECVIWGASLGNICYLFHIAIPLGTMGVLIFGLVAGIYAGCLAVALAEVMKTIPVFLMRAKLTQGIAWIILLMAIGKSIGGLLYFFIFY